MGGELTVKGADMVRAVLQKRKSEFVTLLNGEGNAEHFMRVALTMAQENPKLLQCTEASIYTGFLKAAQLQLNCDGLLGEAYLVPFNDKRQGLIAQLLIGYKGLINLAMNTGHYKDVRARVVYANDPFRISLGTDEFIKHEPTEGDEGGIRGCYAVAVGKDGTPTFEFMFTEKIWSHGKQYSKTWDAKQQRWYSDSIWKTNPEMAFKKTLIRKLCNRLPLSARVKALLAREDRMEQGLALPLEDLDGAIDIDSKTEEVIDEQENKPKKKTSLSGAIKATKKEPHKPETREEMEKKQGDDDRPPNPSEVENNEMFQDLCIAIEDRLKGLYSNDNQKQEEAFQRLATIIKGPLDEGDYNYQDLSQEDLQTIWNKLQA